MFNKFLTIIFVSTLGITTFGHTSFAATAMVDNGLPDEGKLCMKAAPSLIKLPRNVGSADLTSLPPPRVPLTRDSSNGWGIYCDASSSPRARTNSQESVKEAILEELLSAINGQEEGFVFLSLSSPSQFSSQKKLLSSVEDEEKKSAGFPSQLVYRGAIITFSLMGTS